MAKCFKCDTEIKTLLAYSEIVNIYGLDKYKEPFIDDGRHIDSYTSFECPECHEELFTFEADAIKFLKDLK